MTKPAGRATPRFAARALAVGGIGPLHFRLDGGQTLALAGPSGAGKTRLLRAMADLEAHAGDCRLDDIPAHDIDAPIWRRQVTFLAAESAWWADTAGAHLTGDAAQYTPLLAALDVAPELLDSPLAHLSSGQRQRLALIRLLAHRPRVLLLDEPTANLDADNVTRVEALIADYCDANDACSVWVGHDRAQLARVSDCRIALDAYGQIVSCN